VTAAVRCQGIVQIYKTRDLEVVALRDVDLAVEEGETVALLGPSGAGKSTLLCLMAGLLRPSAGRLWLHGTEVSRLPQAALDRLRAAEIGVVLQNPARNLIPYATPAQNVAFAQRGRRADRRRIAELLERVGLAGVRRPAGGLTLRRRTTAAGQRACRGTACAAEPGAWPVRPPPGTPSAGRAVPGCRPHRPRERGRHRFNRPAGAAGPGRAECRGLTGPWSFARDRSRDQVRAG